MSFCSGAFGSIRVWLRAGIVLALCAGPLGAQPMQDYDLRSAAFHVPAGWTVTYSSRDREYDFASPDGRYQLWARWWLPDEPLLGFADIVAHETRPLAGQEALVVHLENDAERMLELAFPKTDVEGEIFLWQLIAAPAQVPLAEHRALFEQLLAGIALDGVPALGGADPPTTPLPETPGGQSGWLAPPAPPAAAAPFTAPHGGAPRYTDATGAFSLPLPAGWTSFATEAPGLREVVLVSPGRDALVLAALASADGGRSARQVLEDFTARIYNDTLQARSIEGEGWPRIAGTRVHAVETVSKVYPINSVALPYARGRVWIYRAPDAPAPFFLATVRAPDASADLSSMLGLIAEGFQPGPGPGPGAAAPVQAVPAATPAQSLPNFAEAMRPPGLLFDGASLSGLTPIAFSGAEFARDAQITPDGLTMDFAEGRGWAKAGFAATGAPLAPPPAGQVWHLRAVIDAARSTSLTLALSPPETATQDPWEAHALRLHLLDLGEGVGRAELTLAGGAEKASVKFFWPKGETTLDLVLRPDSTVELRDASAGVQLLEMRHTTPLPQGPLVALAYMQVPGKNRAAHLVLKRFEAVQEPFAPAPAEGAFVTGDRPGQVLFDGTGLGSVWLPNARREGAFWRDAVLEGDSRGGDAQTGAALRIGWSEPKTGDYLGIVSPEAVLWLDGLHGSGEAALQVGIDPAATGDFEISLSGRYTLPGNLSDNDSYVLRFRRQPDGGYSALSSRRAGEKQGVRTETLAALPKSIRLVLRPGRVRVEAEGVNSDWLVWPEAAEGAGLRMAVHAVADFEGKGALALREIRRAGRAEPPAPAAAPAPGVAPLPEKALFTPPMGPGWRGLSSGAAEFAKLSMAGPKSFLLRRRSPVPDWSRIALVGPEPALVLDYRLDSTPYDLTLSVRPPSDPGPDFGMRLFLSEDPERHEDSAKAVLTLEVPRQGPDAGALVVQFHTGHFSYDHWRRVLPAAWWRAHWDGKVTLRFETGAISVWLAGRPIMRGRTAVAVRGRTLWPVITPGGIEKTAPGQVNLLALSAGWATPGGMDAAERLRLIDDDAFAAADFVDALSADLKGD
ncbi:hypothetical protein C8J27_1174 [Rhodobacter aestuarii]|uniref:Uncharacterized protein n=1 Tax=Rhodobacter aestuarii TaxID=453582 RepID=A0A1N7QH36_9RHOB|nr:hypothetical protein [Rhodobacter aestuarii]PTV93389.1 hypothetical protein C8J27_1174 [Rhodobacter aestuarii]SIT22138.1 hypothetical protein SAMN05421580_11923 [Rhodobacter aestuarii]